MITDHMENLPGSELTLDFPYPAFIWPDPVIGIVEDFHLSGADYEVTPMVIFPNYTWLWCFSILPATEPETAIEHLQKVWLELFPQFPLEYQYSSQMIEQLYGDELVQIRVLGLFSILSVIIAAMGLFALSRFFIQRRLKGAALKKIHRAGIRHILLPELWYYLWLALLSAALSVPACASILIIFSWMAVIYHTWKLARFRPADFIREQ